VCYNFWKPKHKGEGKLIDLNSIYKSSIYHLNKYENSDGQASRNNLIIDFINDKTPFDYICNKCEKEKAFSQTSNLIFYMNGEKFMTVSYTSVKLDKQNSLLIYGSNSIPITDELIITKVFSCVLCKTRIFQYFLFNLEGCIKIGEYPSYVEITNLDLNAFKRVMNELDYNELLKAERCYNFNYSVAAATYIRRIFERIILDTYRINIGDIAEKNEDVFEKKPMSERLEILRPYLPNLPYFTDNLSYGYIFKMLSGSVHTWTDEECLKYYPVMKAVVCSILNHILHLKELESKIKKLSDVNSL